VNPAASRPYMPGYGIVGPREGSGLLPWSWGQQRLTESHDYWVATTWPDGRPHVMPVWAVWDGDALWFSSSLRARKARNLLRDPRCTITTDNPLEPVVVEGRADLLPAGPQREYFLDRMNTKYETSYSIDFVDPATNAVFRVVPKWAFGLVEADFQGSPTRWQFG
jgi:PPOX class probable F420-dependent enzyme